MVLSQAMEASIARQVMAHKKVVMETSIAASQATVAAMAANIAKDMVATVNRATVATDSNRPTINLSIVAMVNRATVAMPAKATASKPAMEDTANRLAMVVTASRLEMEAMAATDNSKVTPHLKSKSRRKA